MNLRRTVSLILTSLTRAKHRRGFGVQSPWAYELVRDVLFEPLHYYAYAEQGLVSEWDRQMFRIRNHFRNQPIIVIDEKGSEARSRYQSVMSGQATPDTILIVEHIDDANATLWDEIVRDQRAIITFDIRKRGMVVFDTKRIKQNYLL